MTFYFVLDSNSMTMACGLRKSFYSGRDGAIVPLSISITNPKQKQIQSITTQLIQIVSLNEIKHEYEIFTTKLDETNENTQENQITTTFELSLPSNLPPTYIPNANGQPDNVPLIAIIYEFRITAQMKGAITPNLRLSVPIGIE